MLLMPVIKEFLSYCYQRTPSVPQLSKIMIVHFFCISILLVAEVFVRILFVFILLFLALFFFLSSDSYVYISRNAYCICKFQFAFRLQQTDFRAPTRHDLTYETFLAFQTFDVYEQCSSCTLLQYAWGFENRTCSGKGHKDKYVLAYDAHCLSLLKGEQTYCLTDAHSMVSNSNGGSFSAGCSIA